MLRSIAFATGVALIGSVIGGLLIGSERGELMGALMALVFFKAGYLYGRPAEGKEPSR